MVHAAVPLLLVAALQATACTAQPGRPEEGQVRLVSRVDINGYATGALQVAVDGEFGAVCSQFFNDVDAGVACRELGFVGGAVLRTLDTGTRGADYLSRGFRASIREEVAASFVLGTLGCTGAEERLTDCTASEDAMAATASYEYNYPDYGSLIGQCEEAFVACGTSTDASDGDVRLAGAEEAEDDNSASGVLEVFRSGAWGRACRLLPNSRQEVTPAQFPQAAARVVCRQLGFSSGSLAPNEAVTGGRISYIDDDTWRIPIVLSGPSCAGTEDSLLDCPGVVMEASDIPCDLTDEVNIVCVNDADATGPSVPVRLMDGEAGPDFEYGRLEVFSNSTWGSVCDRLGFTTASAQVACSALGYDGGAPLRFLQPYVRNGENTVLAGELPVKLDDVDCAGDEVSLLDCPARTTGITNCGFSTPGKTDSTVIACANSIGSTNCPTPAPQESDVRLRGGVGTPCDALHSGVLEIFHEAEWGRVNIATNELAPDVACRQLGFPHGTAVPFDSVTAFTAMSLERPSEIQWLRDARCRGPEARLVDCELIRGFKRDEFPARRTVVVVCRQFAVEAAQEEVTTPGAAQGDLRLRDEVSSGPWVSGRLEIFFEGSWSQVCGLGFDGFDANVACRQLGFGAGTANAAERMRFREDGRLVEFRGVNGSFAEVALTQVGCVGTEASLLECAGDDVLQGFRTRECAERNDPGLFLSCVANPVQGQEGALRLVIGTSGEGYKSGILEVFHAGAWGTVCDGRRLAEPRQFDRDDIYSADYLVGISNAAADVVCQQLGYDVGAFQQINGRDRSSPPWVGELECTGFEEVFTQCDRVLFGDTQECIDSQLRLQCTSFDASERLGDVQLLGGRSADTPAAKPAWAYGAMALHDGFTFADSCLDGPAAAVACRSLSFTTGAPLFVPGDQEAISGPPFEGSRIRRVVCAGTEASLADCNLQTVSSRRGQLIDKFLVESGVPQACAVACSNPMGCRNMGPRAPAAQGDVRLVPVLQLNGTRATSTCDEMHFGALEVFNDGQWGRICAGAAGLDLAGFQLDAVVACRQIGFPFATLLQLTDVNVDDVAATIAWATEVRCTGLEKRLDECFFPEAAGNGAAGSGAASGFPAQPIARASCLDDQTHRVAVVCRMFEIEESNVIR
eukprot:jgi/Ulvmu1/6293/UM288_0001.1